MHDLYSVNEHIRIADHAVDMHRNVIVSAHGRAVAECQMNGSLHFFIFQQIAGDFQERIGSDPEFRQQFPGRTEMIAYAESHGIPIRQSLKKPYSMDRNLLHISFEAGMLEDTWYDGTTPADREMYKLSVSPEDAPDQAEYIQLLYEKGNVIGIQYDGLDVLLKELGVTPKGERDGYTLLSPLGVMYVLNALGGKHGIGRVDIVENRFVGMKSRGIYETPGGTILLAAHRDIETITIDREVQKVRDSLIPEYATLVYNGFWFAPEREAIQALVTKSQETVNGEVRLKLYKGAEHNNAAQKPEAWTLD